MVEKEVIVRRLTLLEEYCRDLHNARESMDFNDFKHDKVLRRYVERTLQLAIEACLDITSHIIAYEGYREPKDNKDIFAVLQEESFLDDGQTVNLKKMAQFRNILVHDYTKIDPEIVYSILQKHLVDILDYAQMIKEQFCSID